MEVKQMYRKGYDLLKKYRYVLLILLLGICFMLIPGEDTPEEEPVEQEQTQEIPELAAQLEQLLCQIKGAGRVKVLLTWAEGPETIYQTDTDTSSEEDRFSQQHQTVLFTDGQRGEQGLVRQLIPARYQGAVILCQGADTPAVHLAIVEAVSNATGLGSDKVSVLKMK